MKFHDRVRLWDCALAGVRAYFRSAGLNEVSTAIRRPAVAIEPHIEPLAADGRWLATSPELAMKRLLAQGSGSIFQIAHVFRGGELGARHREEFHLIEWYRVGGASYREVLADTCGLVAAVHACLQKAGFPAKFAGQREAPEIRFLDLVRSTTGLCLRGDESAHELGPALACVRAEAERSLGLAISGDVAASHQIASPPTEAGCHGGSKNDRSSTAVVRPERLAAWTEFFTLWSELHLDPWLREHAQAGVLLVDFPAPLAALSRIEGRCARRFEYYLGDVELANGYEELRDFVEQESRFAEVNAYRVQQGLAALPLDQSFLRALRRPGLPACAGVAVGLERLLMALCDISTIGDLLIDDPGADSAW